MSLTGDIVRPLPEGEFLIVNNSAVTNSQFSILFFYLEVKRKLHPRSANTHGIENNNSASLSLTSMQVQRPLSFNVELVVIYHYQGKK